MPVEIIGMIGVKPEGVDGAAVHVIGGAIDPAWVKIASLATPRYRAAAAPLPGGKVIVTGGHRSGVGEIYTAVVRIDLGSDGRLRRAVVRAGNGVTHAGNGVAGAAHGSPGVANGRPEGENDSPGPARGAVAAVNSVAGPLNDVAGPANRVAAPIPHDAPGPRLVPSGAAPRRPTALVRAISRAEREALLTGTYPPR